MTDLLTTRQVQDILKVDRITIYRMLQDGRLKGIKVGSQWRFLARDVERLVSGEQPLDNTPVETNGTVFPVHCIQTIQDLFSGVSGLSALVLDSEGNRVTEWSCEEDIAGLILRTEQGQADDAAALRSFAQNPAETFVSPVGLHSAAAAIHDGYSIAGWFLAGQVYLEEKNTAQVAELASRYSLDASEAAEKIKKAVVVSAGQWIQMQGWAVKAAQAVESILHERSGFMQRLQKIADLTQVVEGGKG